MGKPTVDISELIGKIIIGFIEVEPKNDHY